MSCPESSLKSATGAAIGLAMASLGSASMMVAGCLATTSPALAQPPAKQSVGPLRVHPDNPRYFTDGSGKAVYLTGSHVWNTLQDQGTG
ncbi:MAG: hypothetical protein AB7F89_03030 [Pirellulaceae bacterium]